eukprot:UN07560
MYMRNKDVLSNLENLTLLDNHNLSGVVESLEEYIKINNLKKPTVNCIESDLKQVNICHQKGVFKSVGSRHVLHHIRGEFNRKLSDIINDLYDNKSIDNETIFFGITAPNDYNR